MDWTIPKLNSIFSFAGIALFFLCNPVLTQGTFAREIPGDSLELRMEPYGSFRGHFAFFNGEVEFQENASRIGLRIGVKKREVFFFTGIELGINLFKSNSQFNADGNTDGGFIVATSEQASQVFNSRLGFLGIDFGKWGQFSVGKQWSVYYDITSYTDNFNVFGGQGSATYVAGTDGGEIGIGRADQSLIYRNRFGPVSLGLQLQAKNAFNGQFIDGFGFSTQIKIVEGLKAGVAYNKSYLKDETVEDAPVLGLDDQPTYFTTGLTYNRDNLILGAVYAKQSDGDLTEGIILIPDFGEIGPTVVFDAYGYEVFAKYFWKRFAFLGGFNYYQPDIDEIGRISGQIPLDEDFKTSNLILGLEYRPSRLAYFYSEARIANGKGPLGFEVQDVFTIGIRLEAEHVFLKKLKYPTN